MIMNIIYHKMRVNWFEDNIIVTLHLLQDSRWDVDVRMANKEIFKEFQL